MEENRTFIQVEIPVKEVRFIINKSINKVKKGKEFDSFGGLCRGIIVMVKEQEIRIGFENKEWFTLFG